MMLVQTLQSVGHSEVKLALSAAIQAKSATLQRYGGTAEVAVFGRNLRWPESHLRDEEEIPYSALGANGEVWRATLARTAAKLALINTDANDKLRRATLRRCGKVPPVLLPGTRVYIYSPHPTKGRYRNDPYRWRGPAMIVAQEGEAKYFVSWRGRILLVARAQLRLASAEEASTSSSNVSRSARVATLAASPKRFAGRRFSVAVSPAMVARPRESGGHSVSTECAMARKQLVNQG